MKKFFCLIISVVFIFSITMVTVRAGEKDSLNLSGYIQLDKVYDKSVDSIETVNIDVLYFSGREGANVIDFLKQSWVRVDYLDKDADLLEVYNQNKDKENILDGEKTSFSFYDIPVTQNGTYIFCGWTFGYSDEFFNGVPDLIYSIDVTEIGTSYVLELESATIKTSDGNKVETLKSGEKVNGEIVFNGNYARNTQLYMALYDENGVIRDVKFSNTPVTTGKSAVFTTESMTIPENSERYYVKMFLWTDGLEPLSNTVTIK